jgi:hypothetical protein
MRHDRWLAAAGDCRQSERRAGVCKLAHERNGIDFASHRREAGDDCSALEFYRERSGRNRLGAGSAHSRRQRIAKCESLLAKPRFW